MENKKEEISVVNCPHCIHCYEHFCSNCDRYEPKDQYVGYCCGQIVKADGWCKDWK